MADNGNIIPKRQPGAGTVLMVAHSSSKTGGGEEDFLKLIQYLNGYFRIIGVFPQGEKVGEYEKFTDMKILTQPIVFHFYSFNPLKYLKYVLKSFHNGVLLYSSLKKIENKVDLCYINSSVSLMEIIVVYLLGFKCIVSLKEVIEPAFIRKLVYSLIEKTASEIIVISESLKRQYLECTRSLKTNLIYAYENDVKTQIEPTYKMPENAENSFVVLCIGGIYPLKNQEFLLRSACSVKSEKKIELKFIGAVFDANYYRKLERISRDITRPGLDVVFLGELDKSLTNCYLSKSDCVVITSKKEGMSKVFIETLAARKPVISTKVGVAPEIIKNNDNGILIDENDAETLAGSLSKLIEDESFRRRIADNGFKTFCETFQHYDSLTRYKKLFDKILFNE